MAKWMSSTTSTVIFSSPYSLWNSSASWSVNPMDIARFPLNINHIMRNIHSYESYLRNPNNTTPDALNARNNLSAIPFDTVSTCNSKHSAALQARYWKTWYKFSIFTGIIYFYQKDNRFSSQWLLFLPRLS
jgi:hypothetical protein